MYIYKIAPKSKSRNRDTYDYISPLEIKPGTIVRIELGRSKVNGVVLGISSEKKFATKQILKLVSLGPMLTENQIKLAKLIQNEYMSALGETLFAFIPTMNIGDIKKIGGDTAVARRKNQNDELLITSNSNRNYFYTELLFKTEGQSLIVLPEISQIDSLYKKLQKILPNKKIYRYYSSIKSEQKRIIWSELLKGSNAILLTTRHGLLLPFTNLSLICIDDPLNFAYQEDQAPHYQAFFVARKLKNLFGCKLIIGESVPDLNSFAAYKNKKISLRPMKNNLKISASPPFFKFGEDINLIKIIRDSLQRKNRVCFIGPWQNQVGLICGDCKTGIDCQNCGGEDFDQDTLSCVKCFSSTPLCQNCKSPKIKPVGFSYKAIKSQIVDTFPEYKDQVTQDPSHFKDHLITIASPKEIAECSVDYGVAVFPYFDKMANFASLGYRHKIFRFIYDLPRISINRVFLCGEGQSEDRFASQIINFKYEDFINQELRARKQINLPPFARAVEIVLKTKNRNLAEKNFEKISQKTNITVIPLRSSERAKYVRVRGLFFVENKKWPHIKKILEDINIHNCHFEIDRGEYL